jgi:hypothetical protein
MSQKGEERSSLHLISAEPNPLILYVPIFCAKILQTVRKVGETISNSGAGRIFAVCGRSKREKSLIVGFRATFFGLLATFRTGA